MSEKSKHNVLDVMATTRCLLPVNMFFSERQCLNGYILKVCDAIGYTNNSNFV